VLTAHQSVSLKPQMPGSIYDSDQWPTLIKFMTDAMVKMENAFKEPLAGINTGLQKRERQV